MKLLLVICFLLLTITCTVCTHEHGTQAIKLSKNLSIDDANPQDFLELNQKGLDILRRAAQLHGDLADTALRLSVSIRSPNGIHRGQSLVAEPPYENYDLENRFYIDRRKGEEIGHFMNRFAGFVFENIVILNEDGNRNYNLLTHQYASAESSGFNTFRYFPHKYIQAALTKPKQVSYAGDIMLNRKEVSQVLIGSGSAITRLSFDKQNGYLVKVESLANYPPYGDGLSFKEFSDYKKIGSLVLPQVIHSGSEYEAWGHVVNRFELKVIDEKDKPMHNQLVGFELADYSQGPRDELVELAPNVYLIQNITADTSGDGYNILFAVFDEYILVGEAPVSPAISNKAIAHIRSVSDLPIKYLIQSHHHSDHWGGIRTYIAEGTTIVATPGNKPILERIAKAQSALNPDRQSAAQKPLNLELVTQRLTIDALGNQAVIHDVGPTNHANEMLVIYFPQQGLLWQADLMKLGSWPLNDPRTDHLRRKISDLDLDVKIIAGVHGQVMSGEILQEWLEQ